MRELPDLRLGTGHPDNNPVVIRSEHRSRGALVVGQPGMGKSSLLVQMALQDIENNAAVCFIDPHDSVQELLRRIPARRRQDVVLLSLLHDESPLWPVLDQARRAEDALVVAKLLTDSWRAQFGEMSVGPRAESILFHTLMSLQTDQISPLELLAALASRSYRRVQLDQKDQAGNDFPLLLFWNETVAALQERTFQDWSQSIANKLAPMVLDPWLKRAFCGTPPAAWFSTQPFNVVVNSPGLSSVTWLRDGRLLAELEYGGEPCVIEIGDELDAHLVDGRGPDLIYSKAYPEGFRVGDRFVEIDNEDPALHLTQGDAYSMSSVVRDQIERRQRRRGWRRFADFYLAERGVRVRESMDIGDLLDDGRIVLVEIPETHGANVTQAVGTFAILSAFLRGMRNMSLPRERRVPCSVYVDEAELFVNAGIDRTLAELRKAGVSMTLAVQRMGQLGGRNGQIRQGVIDNVGSIISLGPGLEEAKEMADLLKLDVNQIRKLGRGEGYASLLSADWARADANRFKFSGLEAPLDDCSMEIRQENLERFYQDPKSADSVFRERVQRIMANFAKKTPAAGGVPGGLGANPTGLQAAGLTGFPGLDTGADQTPS